jgi:hypothetical protein
LLVIPWATISNGIMSIQPTQTEAFLSPDRTWTKSFRSRMELTPGGSQTAETSLTVEFQMYSFQTDDTSKTIRYLLVSLQGSEVNPSVRGNLASNQDDKRGFYTDSVEVTIEWLDATPLEVMIAQAAPASSSWQGGAGTSSSVDFNASLGSFGYTPTAGVSVGGSITNSFTLDLSDYTIKEIQDGNRLTHQVLLSMTEGGKYHDPTDLVDMEGGGLGGAWEQLKGLVAGTIPGRLYNLPPRAVSSLEVPTQVLFRTAENFNAQRRLRVTITHKCMLVEKTFEAAKIEVDQTPKQYPCYIDETIDFSLVSGI